MVSGFRYWRHLDCLYFRRLFRHLEVGVEFGEEQKDSES